MTYTVHVGPIVWNREIGRHRTDKVGQGAAVGMRRADRVGQSGWYASARLCIALLTTWALN